MTQCIGNRQQTMLYLQGVPTTNAIHVCQPSYQLSSLSPEQWTCREICWDHQELIPQGQRRRPILYTAIMVYRNTPLNGTLQLLMQILQGRQAHTDLPLSHVAKVQMGIKHASQSTAEILHVKD